MKKSLTKYKQKKYLKCKLLWIFRWIWEFNCHFKNGYAGSIIADATKSQAAGQTKVNLNP